jgi:UDP-N-acetylmuramoylalanine--D-glutamate ligase
MTALEQFKTKVNGKKVGVVGIGISNTPLIKMLLENGAIVSAFDKKDREKFGDFAFEIEALGIPLYLGKDYLKNINCELIFKSPGIRFDMPELLKAKENGTEITSEMELFFDLCPCKIIAVTGSDGKTTTTTLIYEMLKASGLKCHLGGNIGNPLLPQIDEIEKEDIVVLELSSFQLHTMKKSPDIAVITNISPNHLDWHKSYEEYIEAKKNIFINQNSTSRLVLNLDNEITKGFANEANGEVCYFSYNQKVDNGIYFNKNEDLVFANSETVIINRKDIKLVGKHNVENIMAAACAVWGLASVESIKKVANEFGGVAHRLELVRELYGVKYYNSSIDSSPSRTIAALSTFEQKVILLTGGKSKNIPYDSLGKPIAEKAKILITIGETAKDIEKALADETAKSGKGKDILVLRCNTYEELVQTARRNAKEGDIVILSPASTSFDMFKNFEERGNTFKAIVNSLN